METTTGSATESATDYSDAPFVAKSPGPYGGSGYYGKGFTIEEAKANLKGSGGSLARYVVFKMPEGAVDVTVSGFDGSISWSWAEGYDGPAQVELEVVASRGTTK